MEQKTNAVQSRCGYIRGGKTGTRDSIIRREDFIWYPANVYTWFMWFSCYPHIEKLLNPYRTAKFTSTRKDLSSGRQVGATIAKIDESLKLVKAWEFGCEAYIKYMRVRVARELKDFLRRYQEGALVTLALLDCAGKGCWGVISRAEDISLSEFPGIQGKDPVEVWCLLERLRVLMRGALGARRFSSVFSKYLE